MYLLTASEFSATSSSDLLHLNKYDYIQAQNQAFYGIEIVCDHTVAVCPKSGIKEKKKRNKIQKEQAQKS